MYKAYGVPVGVDQLPHVELTREIARRFNFLYGEIFPIPEPLLAEVPKLLGIDGRKMSKSYDNSIFMSDRGETLKKKVAAMFTDPQRQRKSDPGRPELCNVFTFHQLYSPPKDGRGDRACLPGCVHRLHGMQAATGRCRCGGDEADPRAAGLLPGPSRRGHGRSSRTAISGPPELRRRRWQKCGKR